MSKGDTGFRQPAAWSARPDCGPMGGGRAWPGFEIDLSKPQARVWRSRGRAAAHGHTKQPGPNMASNAAPGTPVGSEAITTRRAAHAGTGRGSG